MIDLEPKLEKIKDKILKYFPKQGSHTLDHTERIYSLAVRIAEKEGKANIEVIKLAALLHNIARAAQGDHAIKGSKMARDVLVEEGYGKQIIDQVCDCIETHRSSKKLEPRSIEGAILQDADRLEMLGAIVIARTFGKGIIKRVPMYDPNIPPSKVYPSRNAGRTSLNRLKEKVLLITPDQFHSKFAKKLAKARHKFIQDFIDRFEKEWTGEL
jgi:uncharacterized protein